MFAFPDVPFLTVNVYVQGSKAPRLDCIDIYAFHITHPASSVINLATAMRKESLDPGYLKSVPTKCKEKARKKKNHSKQ